MSTIDSRNLTPTTTLPGGPDPCSLIIEGATEHAIFMTDREGQVLTWNPGVERILGYSREEWVGQSSSIIFTPEDRADGAPEYEMTTAREKGHVEDLRWHLKKDGTRFFCDGFLTPLYGAGRELIGYSKVLRDATEQHRLAAALNESENRLRLITDAFPALISYVDTEYRYRFANRAYQDWFGIPPEKILEIPARDVVGQAVFQERLPRFQEVLRFGKTVRFEGELLDKDGRRRYTDTLYVPDFAVDGTVQGAFILSQDITERKLLEIEQGQLLAQTQARAEREALIRRIGDGIRLSLPPEEIEAQAMEALGRTLAADRCCLMSMDLTRDQVTIAGEWYTAGLAGISGRYPASALEIDFTSLLNTPEPLVVGEGRLERAGLASPLGVTSFIIVPFYQGGRLVGALGLAMTDGWRKWSAEEVALTQTVAGQLRAVSEAARQQQRQRTIAQQLQEALQPPTPPLLPGLKLASYYRPALDEASVGGDFFDVFPVADGCTALVVADLSGKGLAAAQQVAMVRHMLRFALYNEPTLAEAVAALQRILVRYKLLSGFVTLFVGMYDHRQGTLTYVNCGQEPGLLWRVAGSEIERLGPTGAVLGAFPSPYEQKRVELRSGDVLALFTDGLTEAGPGRTSLLEISGVSRLLEICCRQARQIPDPQMVVDNLIGGMEAFARGGMRDDIALLVGVVTDQTGE